MSKDTRSTHWTSIVVAIFVGALIWGVTSIFANNADPTGSKLYWIAGYPVSLIAALGIAFYAKSNTWLAGLAIILTQLIAVLLFAKGDNTQLVFGLVAYGIYALPLLGASWLGYWLSRRVRA